MKFLVKTVLATSLISGFALANTNPVNLHDRNVAQGEYQAFKSGTGEDPLEKVRSGYKSSYSNDLDNGLMERKANIQGQMLNSENERLSGFVEGFSRSKKEDKRAIYEEAKKGDGTFDFESFSSSYTDYLSTNRGVAYEAIGDRREFAQDIINETASLTLQSGNAHSDNAYIAAQNVIDIINADTNAYTSRVRESLDDAINANREKVPVGAEAFELAYIFDGECGSACDVPPVVDPGDPDCLYDDDNYIVIDESDHSEYGVWSEKDEGEQYILNGNSIYYYSRRSTDRSGEWVEDEVERGSKAGYTTGKSMRLEGGGGQFGSSYVEWFEICNA